MAMAGRQAALRGTLLHVWLSGPSGKPTGTHPVSPTRLGVTQVSAAGPQALVAGSAVLHHQIIDGMWRNPASCRGTLPWWAGLNAGVSGDCRGRGGRGGGRDFQVTDHFGARRNPASRWMQRADEGKVDVSTRRSSRAQRRMDRADARFASLAALI